MSNREYTAERPGGQPRPNVDDFRAYGAAYSLIPLHLPDAVQTVRRKGVSVTMKTGKRPLHPGWTTKAYASAKVLAYAERTGCNVGVRLTDTQVVVDVDPRHGGIEGFEDLCFDLDIDPSRYPCVTTGGGGAHLYATIPPGTKLRDTIENYGGVEFKSVGRQVLAAGCIHPDSDKLYTFTAGHPNINVQVPAPEALLDLITRPERTASVGGGHVTPERLGRALKALDPCNFREHGRWLQVMMASHYCTGGDGREVFIEWSTSDPEYTNMGDAIGRRWDSLHADHNSGVTAATINMHLKEAGRRDLFLRESNAAEDFADDDFLMDATEPLPWPRNESWFKNRKGAHHA